MSVSLCRRWSVSRLEQRLVDLIADRVPSDEEEGTDTDNPYQFSTQCVWDITGVVLVLKYNIINIDKRRDNWFEQIIQECVSDIFR